MIFKRVSKNSIQLSDIRWFNRHLHGSILKASRSKMSKTSNDLLLCLVLKVKFQKGIGIHFNIG